MPPELGKRALNVRFPDITVCDRDLSFFAIRIPTCKDHFDRVVLHFPQPSLRRRLRLRRNKVETLYTVGTIDEPSPQDLLHVPMAWIEMSLRLL